jgi:two-component system LytT family response regulator
MTIRVVVADDEPLSRARVRMYAGSHDDVAIVAEAADAQEALDAVTSHHPDVLFVDVEMPDGSGVEVVRSLEPEERPVVVFVTAFTNYAVDAFDVGAVHYLVKPFGPDEIDAAMRRIREALTARAANAAVSHLAAHLQRHQEPELLQRVVVKHNGRALLLRIEQIDWIEGAGNYSRLHANGARHLLRESLTSLERKLDRRQFARVHRSTIVNLDRISELHPTSHGDYTILLRDGTRLVLSRGYRARLEALLGHL